MASDVVVVCSEVFCEDSGGAVVLEARHGFQSSSDCSVESFDSVVAVPLD